MHSSRAVEAVVIGAGFYGLSVALFLREELGIKNIVVIEKESQVMTRASYVNQARVHNGYHYPRSVLTAHRSAVNFPIFTREYEQSIVNDFTKYYAISRSLSKVNARQFVQFCHKINIPVRQVDADVKTLFNPHLTEDVFEVTEYAFDSHKLRDLLLARIKRTGGIIIQTGEDVQKIESIDDGIHVVTDQASYVAGKVINCSYSQINHLHRSSSLPLVSLKHEIAEMCLVELPHNLDRFSVTVMDGPFFSIMPFPSRGLHTLSHVRYTPHEAWLDDGQTPLEKQDAHRYFATLDITSQFKKMKADVVRYIPAMRDMKLVDTITEVKTVLVKSEDDDSRPILCNSDFGIKNYTCIMGGKLDNIYDVFEELRLSYGE